MSNEFLREERYIVFKLSDVERYLTDKDRANIAMMKMEIAAGRDCANKPPFKGLIVEADWPEYEPTWKAIEARINGVQQVPSVPMDVIADYLVSISAHLACRDDAKAQAEIRELLKMLAAAPKPAPSVPDDVVEQAVNRFLSWKLPKDFHPDGGMVFIPTKGRGYDSPHWPVGTNLLNAQQAREMLRYVLDAAPEAKP